MSRTLIIIVTVAALGALAWFFFFREHSADISITNFPPQGDVIIAFGDSLVEGVGARDGYDFVSVAGKTIGLPILNFGQAGDTTDRALQRIEDALDAEPDVAIILLGGNDALRRLSKADTEKNLETIIRAFQAEGAVTIILGVKGSLLGDAYADMYEGLAERTGSLYLSNVLEGLFRDPRYMDDPIHPNDAGYAIIAGRVVELLRQLGFGEGR